MAHTRQWMSDRQLLLVIAIWVLTLADAIRQGITIPTSELAFRWTRHPAYELIAFALLAPPGLVLVNHFLPLRVRWFDWPKRLIDRRFGDGTVDRFWRCLRPLPLMSIGAFALGVTGYWASESVGAPSGAFAISSIFIAFGFGFLIGALLDGCVLRKTLPGMTE